MIGVYLITNTKNFKVYVGQSWDIEKRWRDHKERSNKGQDTHLYSAIRKYGVDNFNFTILKTFSDSPLTQILLDQYEDHFIKQYGSMEREKGYNKKGGGSYGKHGEESKLKNSQSKKKYYEDHPELCIAYREKMKEYRKKHPEFSIKYKLKIKEYYKNNPKAVKVASERQKNYAKTHRDNIKNRYIKRKIPIYCLTNKILYDSVHETANKLNIHAGSVSKCCKGKIHDTQGYQFQYYKDYLAGKNNSYIDKTDSCKRKVICIETNIVYKSIVEAQKSTGLNHISMCCRGKQKTSGGFHWRYADQDPPPSK